MKIEWVKYLRSWKGSEVGDVRQVLQFVADDLVRKGIVELSSDPDEVVVEPVKEVEVMVSKPTPVVPNKVVPKSAKKKG